MSRLVGSANVLDQPLYDTVQLPIVAGPQVVNFFAIPVGGAFTAAIAKTWEHTNLVQAGRIETGNELMITAVSMYVKTQAGGGAGVTLADASAVSSGYCQLRIGQVTYLTLPNQMIPNGGAEIVANGNAAAASTHVTHSVSAISNRFHLKNTFVLEADESVQVECHVTAAIAAVTDLVFVLWGDYTRPVR